MKLGDGALRIPRPRGPSADAVLALARSWPGVIDAWLTEAWLGLAFADDAEAHVEPAQLAALAALASESSRAPSEHVIRVRYDGADLAEVARMAGLSAAEVVERHSRAEYTVLFVGFSPGFAYLGGLPRELEVPRLPSPRTRVPKNAVAIGGPYAGVYPFESPGGWRLLGTALEVDLFDPERGALLRAGDRVRFERTER